MTTILLFALIALLIFMVYQATLAHYNTMEIERLEALKKTLRNSI